VRVYTQSSAAPVLDGYVGKAAMGSAAYFRFNRDAAVYLAESIGPNLRQRGADDFRNKALLAMSVGELESLRFVKTRNGGFTLTRSSGAWAAAGRKLTAEKAAEIVLAVTSLRFTEFAPADTPPQNTGLDKPVVDLVVGGEGRSERILIGREDAGRRYAKVAGRKAVGFVSKYDVDSLLKLL